MTLKAEKIYNTLMEEINTGKLAPGDRIVGDKVAERLGVSRTPIREALKKLETHAFVTRIPDVGYSVTKPSKTLLFNLFEIREILGKETLKLACDRASDRQIQKAEKWFHEAEAAIQKHDIEKYISRNLEFHKAVSEGCKNVQLISLFQNYQERYFDKPIIYKFTDADWLALSKEHQQILNALKERDPQAAGDAIKNHWSADKLLQLYFGS